MLDTIELLERIGGDASLRHASSDELLGLLEEAGASDALKEATATADGAPLLAALGLSPLYQIQVTQVPSNDEEEDDDDDGDPREPERLPGTDPDVSLPAPRR